jgi:hypothetical protein
MTQEARDLEPTVIAAGRYNPAMRYYAFLIGVSVVLLAGCRGYSLDMSGLEAYSHENADDTNDRLSMSALDRAASPGMEDAGRGLTMADAESSFMRATEKTNERLNMSNLDRLSNEHVKPASDGLTMSDLEKAVSGPTDPDNHKIKKK